MSWETEEEKQEKSTTKSKFHIDSWKKNLICGALCIAFGASVTGIICGKRIDSKQYLINELHERLEKQREKVKEAENNAKTVYVTVPVYVTESIETSKETAPVTEVTETGTTAIETEVPEDNEYQVKLLTNPLTKASPYQSKPPAPAMYTVYWINVKRSDLASMTASDFQFFTDYISEKYKSDDIVYFYIRITDYPDIIIDCPINVYEKNTLFVCRSRYDDTAKCDVSSYIICDMDINDPEQITLAGYGKDEYKLPKKDENEVYSFSDFNEELWNRILKMQESADFLWG